MAAHNLIYYSVGRTVSYPTGTPAVILKNGKTPTNYEPTLLSRQRGQ
jgi:hypothetical protein